MASTFARYVFETSKLETPFNKPIKRILIHQQDLSLSIPILNTEGGSG